MASARDEYAKLLDDVSRGVVTREVCDGLRRYQLRAAYSAAETRERALPTLRACADALVSDSILTREEWDRFVDALSALSVSWSDFSHSFTEQADSLVIASINAGNFPTLTEAPMVMKAGEVAYLKLDATLMKEVTIREYRGGYSGFSFPIGKTGIRYRIGAVRGRSVPVGTQLQIDDNGSLIVTSMRAVFFGRQKTVELPYSKLLNLEVFSDGLQFHQSNRQRAPLFRVGRSEVVAATVNAAAQRSSTE